MGQTIGYVRVSSDTQTVDNQRLAILDYFNKQDIKVDDWIKGKEVHCESIWGRKGNILPKACKDPRISTR
jgi:DNA invertase Pin-like site-specific DNA recombinase